MVLEHRHRPSVVSCVSMFQYPLRVEWCWNIVFTSGKAVFDFSFSTLYGSNGVGTHSEGTEYEWQYGFQYPLRVEWCWNLGASMFRIRLSGVSVPSTGRMVLELVLELVVTGRRPSFSTLYGSNGVGTSMRAKLINTNLCFSTLYGSNGVGTSMRAKLINTNLCFSTLYGSNGVGTCCCHHPIPHQSCFSTLYGSNGVGTLLWADLCR